MLEVLGQSSMGIGHVSTVNGSATLIAGGNLTDRNATSSSDVTARSIFLTSRFGGIGSASNAFDFDSSNNALGSVNATAPGAIVLNETSGDMRVGQITSNSKVTLTGAGGIVDASNDGVADVIGTTLVLAASNGHIGSSSNNHILANLVWRRKVLLTA